MSKLNISPTFMHSKAQKENQIEPIYDQSFLDYVLTRLNNFSGNNYISRIVCKILTKEYIIIVPRQKCIQDCYDLPEVAQTLRKVGFYVELEDSTLAKASNTMSMLICWDPQVMLSHTAEQILDEPSQYNLYITVMQYIRAEHNVTDISLAAKGGLTIRGFTTYKWVAISLPTREMYEEAIIVGDFLWKNGYFVGIAENHRRNGTWTMFVSWEPYIVGTKGKHTEDFAFTGFTPKSWN